MKTNAKNQLIQNFSLFCGQLWFPGQKQGLGYNTKYPRMKSDQKTYFLKCSQNHPKCLNIYFFQKCTKMFHFSHCGGGQDFQEKLLGETSYFGYYCIFLTSVIKFALGGGQYLPNQTKPKNYFYFRCHLILFIQISHPIQGDKL